MKILFLSDNFPPEVNAPASRVFERARYWVKWGHEVTVITCAPNFPQGKVYEGYKNKWYQVEYMDGIKVVRVKTFISKNEGFILRIIDFVSYMWMAIIASFFQKTPDVIVATSPQFFTVVAGYKISFFKRRPFFFELSDLWPASIAAVGSLSSNSKLYKLIEKLELFLYRHSKKVIAQTQAFKDDLVSRGIPAEKITVVYNGVELNQFNPVEKNKNLLKKYNLENRFIIGYIGTQGMAHDLKKVLEVASDLKETNVTFLFVGDGAANQSLLDLKKQQNLNNVIFIPSQPKSEIANYWSLCDVALIHLKNDATFSTVVPSKLFEAMAMGLPILLVAPEGEAARIVNNEKVGLYTRAGDHKAFVDAVQTLQQTPSLLKTCHEHALLAVRQFGREEQARRMLEILER